MDVDEVGADRRLVCLRVRPSLAPIFFHPLLCAATARWKLPGEGLLKVQSEVGGVVGGVIGSVPEGELQSLSSVRPSVSSACIDVVDRTGADNLLLLDASRGERAGCSSDCPSSCRGATDSRKGTRRESFMSS